MVGCATCMAPAWGRSADGGTSSPSADWVARRRAPACRTSSPEQQAAGHDGAGGRAGSRAAAPRRPRRAEQQPPGDAAREDAQQRPAARATRRRARPRPRHSLALPRDRLAAEQHLSAGSRPRARHPRPSRASPAHERGPRSPRSRRRGDRPAPGNDIPRTATPRRRRAPPARSSATRRPLPANAVIRHADVAERSVSETAPAIATAHGAPQQPACAARARRPRRSIASRGRRERAGRRRLPISASPRPEEAARRRSTLARKPGGTAARPEPRMWPVGRTRPWGMACASRAGRRTPCGQDSSFENRRPPHDARRTRPRVRGVKSVDAMTM